MDFCNHIASFFNLPLLSCMFFMYMESPLVYVYLVVNSSLILRHPVRLHPPPSPFSSKGSVMSQCPFGFYLFLLFVFVYFTVDPPGSSKIVKRLLTALFHVNPSLT